MSPIIDTDQQLADALRAEGYDVSTCSGRVEVLYGFYATVLRGGLAWANGPGSNMKWVEVETFADLLDAIN